MLRAGILHLDELRVYNSRIKALQLDSQTTKSPFGVGLLVGAAAVRHGYDTGCHKAELLAINDNTQCVTFDLESMLVSLPSYLPFNAL